MKKAYDERQLTARYKASNRTLIFVLLAVLADGAINQFWGQWTSPWRQATMLLLLAGIVHGLQLGWQDAHYPMRVNAKDQSTVIAVLAAFMAVVVGIGALFKPHRNVPELFQFLLLFLMLVAPMVGMRCRRWHEQRSSADGEPAS